MLASPALAERTSWRWRGPLALFLGFALLYSINLGKLPNPDELHHVLAAKSLLETGEPRIAEGYYTRTFLYTWLVAKSFAVFGYSLSAARVPALLPVAALVALLFIWLRQVAGTRAAWIGALLFGLSPFSVEIAQFSRFYGLQMLSLFVAAVCTFAIPTSDGTGRWLALGLGAAAASVLAFYLQPTTIMGLVGMGLWLTGALLLPLLLGTGLSRRHKLAWLVTLVGLGVVAVLAATALGVPQRFWATYRSTPLFNQRSDGQFWYYHAWYSLLYPTLWPATGVLSLVAIAARPRAGSYLVTVFATAFFLSSFAAAKNLRYFAYAQPFLFALWGIALAALWRPLASWLGVLASRLRAALPADWPMPARAATRVMMALALGFLALANPAWLRTATMLANVTVPPEQPPADWPAADAALRPWVERAKVVVTTEELGALYFLGRYDVRYSPSKLGELAPDQRREFGLDHRTGRPVIATKASLERLIDCYPSGLIVGPAEDWGKPHKINGELARLITDRASPVALPARTGLYAYAWERPPPSARPPSCDELPAIATALP